MRFVSEPSDVEPSSYDQNGPIDYDALKAVISENGPYVLRFSDWQVNFTINITPCRLEGCECDEDVISIVQSSGFTSLSTTILPEQLEGFESLTALADTFLHLPQLLFSPSAEQQYIEGQIHAHLGIKPYDIYEKGLPEEGLKAVLSEDFKKDFWRAHNLQSIFRLLLEHRMMLEAVGGLDGEAKLKELFPSPNDLLALMRDHYTAGFLTGRLISEHFVRYEIEPFAQKGMAYEEAQKRRNEASGKTSSNKRHRRVEAMLTHMEQLANENPALARAGIRVLADLAIEDATAKDSSLWAQGKGRRDEYLDEMKSDLRYQARFQALIKKVP